MGAPSVADPDDLIASDDEDDAVPTMTGAINWKEKRRAQKAVFDSWITSSAGQEALKSGNGGGGARADPDDNQSVQSLFAQHKANTRIVKNAREYQIELFERAKEQNTIAVLDTGSGKTLIAVLLLRWIIDQEIENRAKGRPLRVSFFLVASAPLVFQQFAVLDTNLDHPVARLCGRDNAETWDKPRWSKELYHNKAIVCTAEILFQALSFGYLTMNQINLLIFDEAHHAKKNHSYARIIKDFYLEAPPSSRPRIFGMTASPIDAKVDVVRAAAELETLLDSRIATTSDMSFTSVIHRPKEEVLTYPALPQAARETALLQATRARYGHVPEFTRIFNRAMEVARSLGSWCADCYLLDALSGEKCKKFKASIEQNFHARNSGQDIAELDAALQHVETAAQFAQEHRGVLDVVISQQHISTKVFKLWCYLGEQFAHPSNNNRCIVFVDSRYTARLLDSLFQRIKSEHMTSTFLVGSGNSGHDENSFSFRQQVLVLLKFRKGELNCLFATSVAEEGLDVPDCNLIIRFDMYATMIQYVQSRGRARNPNSKFIHMLEQGNPVHNENFYEVRYAELSMRAYCNQLPENRKLDGNLDDVEALLEPERNMEVRVDPVSGAKLTYGNALNILATFVSAVPTDSHEMQHPTYVVSPRGQQYICEVLLPGNAPLRSMVGKIHAKKTLAKRSAAFEACIELRQKAWIDEHFMPVYQRKLPAMRNALLAVGMKKTNQYAMRLKPAIWAQQRGTLPKQLWITVIDFPEELDRAHQSIAFLTRTQMPHFPSFPVYLNDGRATPVQSEGLSSPLSVDQEKLEKLTAFTFRVFRDVFSKTYEEDATKLSYWLAPATVMMADEMDTSNLRVLDPLEAIDWPQLDEVLDNDEYKWTPGTPNERFIDKFIVDVYDGSRKFYSVGVASSLHQDDPIPDDGNKGKRGGSILDYSVSLWKKSRQAKTWSDNQPVIEAQLALKRRNMLAPPEQKELAPISRAYIVPQPLRISAITPKVATSCLVWPAIIYRFESCLITTEGCDEVGISCAPEFALAAFTKDSNNEGEYDGEEKVNFQRGMGENYERLEFIGDTFLKTTTTISTFIMNPNENEFEFHVRRMLMLCNKNLYQTAMQLRLYEYIRSLAFNRRYWYPEGMKLLFGTGVIKGQEKEMYHKPRKVAMGEKTIADVCEALIGAAYLTHGKPGEDWKPEHWQHAIRAVTKLVNSDDHKMQTWQDYVDAYEKPAYQTAEATAVQKDLAGKVYREHAYAFEHPRLLYSAFMHPSVPYMYEKVPNYQRLEFLGDALFDMASVAYLFSQYPDKDPQWLTEHKMAMVSNRFLGAVCVNMGFHKHLRHHHATLEHQIRDYATELLEAKRAAGHTCRDYWTTVSDPPKCLPDIVEAYVGAMFIDSNFDYGQVQRFFDEHVKWYFADMAVYDSFAKNHPCTRLHTMLQNTFGCVDYRLMARELPSVGGMERKDVAAVVMVHGRIIAHSAGKSGKYGKLRAANKALDVLEGMLRPHFRAEFGCDCTQDADGRVDLGGPRTGVPDVSETMGCGV